MDESVKALKATEIRAFQLRWEGLTSKQVVARLNREFPKLKLNESTYRRWFSREGRLYEQYEIYAAGLLDEMKKRQRMRLARLVDDGIKIIEEQLKEKKPKYRRGFIAQMAADKALSYGLGKPEDSAASRTIIVKMTEPVRPGYVPPGYNPDGSPITNVNDAVELNEEVAANKQQGVAVKRKAAKPTKMPRKKKKRSQGK